VVSRVLRDLRHTARRRSRCRMRRRCLERCCPCRTFRPAPSRSASLAADLATICQARPLSSRWTARSARPRPMKTAASNFPICGRRAVQGGGHG
jgi:hypothetical protein